MQEPTKTPEPGGNTNVKNQAVAWGLASNFLFGLIGMGLIGWALQTWAWPAASPWLLIGGLGVGLLGGGVRFVHEAMALNRS